MGIAVEPCVPRKNIFAHLEITNRGDSANSRALNCEYVRNSAAEHLDAVGAS